MDKKNNFKPLAEHIAGQMVQDLENGSSIFQKPWKDDGTAPFKAPFNAITGKPYSGVPALIIAMKDLDDPRWVTKKQVYFNDLKLEDKAKGTIISFPKSSELKAVVNDRGEKVRDGDGKVQMEEQKLEKTFYVKAVLYNAAQVEGLPSLAETMEKRQASQTQTPSERAQQIIDNSKVRIERAYDAQMYDPWTDKILMPDKAEFASDAKYYATMMREMVQWAGTEERAPLSQENEIRPFAEVREKLRANIATLMISAELNLGFEPLETKTEVEAFTKLLKEHPKELFHAAGEAQWLTRYVLGMEKELEIKEELTNEVQQDQQEELTTEAKQETGPAKTNPNKLTPGDVIAYNATNYKVLNNLKAGRVEIEIESTGAHVKPAPKDNLYKSLLEARNNPVELGESRGSGIGRDDQEMAMDEVFEVSR